MLLMRPILKSSTVAFAISYSVLLASFLVFDGAVKVDAFPSSFPYISQRSIIKTVHLTQQQQQQQRTATEIHSMPSALLESSQREDEYGNNIAQYLLDLHDARSTFDFCGGMMFEFRLTARLYDHLKQVADNDVDSSTAQPKIFDAEESRMFHIPDYSKSAFADNIRLFHGRELRSIPDAKGGFGFVLQLSYADEDHGADPEGWSNQEIATYDGWGHDAGRTWRKANDYEAEGVKDFKENFGEKAFGLNHRFYLHLDGDNKVWLSAEDGCEGTPKDTKNPIRQMFGF